MDKRVRSKKERTALSEQFRHVLVAAGWDPLEGGAEEEWQKNTNKLLLDDVGLFLFQFQKRGYVRTRGLCWDYIKACLSKSENRQLWFTDGYSLVL